MLKLIIKKSELPAVSTDGNYYFRVRVVTSNGDKASYWTPLLSVQLPIISGSKMVYSPLTASAYETDLGGGRYSILLSWDDPNNFSVYDVYARWYDTTGATLGWEYVYSTTSRTYEYITDVADYTNPNVKVELAIVRPTYQKFAGTDDLTALALLITPQIQISSI